ncbi:MAG: hypothetical protein GX324_02940 [Aeromonadales bacterium]|nr:hypothetical protein [Aeromonadales bacterium]
MNPYLVIITSLLLSACSNLTSLPYFNKDEPITAHTPGIGISQSEPPQLASIAFASDTQFNSERIKGCVDELLAAIEEEGRVINYVGRDTLTATAVLAGEKRQLGVLPSQYQIRFHLAVLSQGEGTRYGFSRITLAQEDRFNYNTHDFKPLSPTSNDLTAVYHSLKDLYQALDDCMAEPESGAKQDS